MTIENNGVSEFFSISFLNGISIEQNSGSIISNVSKKLDYLVMGEKPTRRKIDAANELGIKIINQADWLKMLNKRS